MIRKLRRKLILLSMSALLLVLSVIIIGANAVNFYSVVRDADGLLTILSENKGAFPRNQGEGRGNRLPPDMSLEVPYETRYFTVLFSSDGSLIQVNTSRIVAVDQTEAVSMAKSVLGNEKGFVGDFRYFVKAGEGTVRLIFLDCGRKLDSCRRFLLASVGISLAGFLVVFLLIAVFSKRIIRPVSESYEKQKRFITDAGHELKTPLTIISADADVLAMDLGENEWLEDIRKQVERLTVLTKGLVTLSRMEEAGETMPMIVFPFSDVVSEAAASFQAPAQTQKKPLALSIQPMLSLKGNEKAIEQLVGILLDNALKYSPEGSTIYLSAFKQGKTVVLAVTNETLAPITKEELPLLFERFYRMDPSRSSQTSGYGIGLSLAKAIVTAHSGKLQAQSKEKSSLTVMASFPA